MDTNWVGINEELSTYIDEFNFNIIKKIEPIKFIDEIRQSPYYFYYFGGGFNMIKRTPLQVPHSPINTERNYIQNLNDAYSEHAGHIINVIDDDNAVVSKYRKHLDRARISFYESEEVKIASRKSTAPDSDEFNDLVTSIERYIGNELDDDYPDGFTKVKSVEKKAGTYNMPTSMLISHLVDSNVCVGVCHQLSNENRIKWTVKRIKILDGVLDVSLRVLFILSVYNKSMEKERIVVYDYVSCNNDWKNHQFTYVGLQKTINDSLHLLLAKQLIVCKINQNENMYLLSNIGNALVTELATEVYAVKLYKAIHQTDIILHDIAKEQLLSYINSQI